MKRVGKVFEQGITSASWSFLQKADSAARDRDTIGAKRVRSQNDAMHSSSDLRFNFSPFYFNRLQILGLLKLARLWVFCIWKEDDHNRAWMGADFYAGSSPFSNFASTIKKKQPHMKIYNHFLEGGISHWVSLKVWAEAHLPDLHCKPSPPLKLFFSIIRSWDLHFQLIICLTSEFLRGLLMIITQKAKSRIKGFECPFR